MINQLKAKEQAKVLLEHLKTTEGGNLNMMLAISQTLCASIIISAAVANNSDVEAIREVLDRFKSIVLDECVAQGL